MQASAGLWLSLPFDIGLWQSPRKGSLRWHFCGQELLAKAQLKQTEAAAAAEAAQAGSEILQQQLRAVDAELQHLKATSTRDAASLEEAHRQSRDFSAKLQAVEMVHLRHL